MIDEPRYKIYEYDNKDSFMSRFRNSKLFKFITVGAISLGLTLISPSINNIKNIFNSESQLEKLINYEIQKSEGIMSKEDNKNNTIKNYNNLELTIKNSNLLNIREEIDYELVKEINNPKIRQLYLESVIKKLHYEKEVDTPRQLRTANYSGKKHNRAIMQVNYFTVNPEDKGEKEIKMDMTVHSQAFNLEKEDDFMSVIFHEYNHVRALNRKKIIDDNKDYINASSDLKWRDLYDNQNYSDNISYKKRFIKQNIRKEITELLAVSEQIHLQENKLNVSESYSNTRYYRYLRHYQDLFRSLKGLNANEEFKEELKEIFYEDWFEKREIYPLINI